MVVYKVVDYVFQFLQAPANFKRVVNRRSLLFFYFLNKLLKTFLLLLESFAFDSLFVLDLVDDIVHHLFGFHYAPDVLIEEAIGFALDCNVLGLHIFSWHADIARSSRRFLFLSFSLLSLHFALSCLHCVFRQVTERKVAWLGTKCWHVSNNALKKVEYVKVQFILPFSVGSCKKSVANALEALDVNSNILERFF